MLISIFAALLLGFHVAAGAANVKAEGAVILMHRCSSLDPRDQFLLKCFRLLADLYENLVKVGPDGKLIGGVAKEWEWDLPTKTLTFQLRDDRRWSDGHPVTSKDFLLSWRRIIAEEGASNSMREFLMGIAGAKLCVGKPISSCPSGLSTPTPHTLVVQFDEIDRLFALRTVYGALAPIPAHTFLQHGDDWLRQSHVPFNGPYRISPEHRFDELDLSSTPLKLTVNPYHPEMGANNIHNAIYRVEPAEFATSVYRNIILSPLKPDLFFTPNSIKEDYESILENLAWTYEPLSLINMKFLMLNRNYVHDNLIEAMKYAVVPELYGSRLTGKSEKQQPVDRLYNHPNAQTPFHNKLTKLNRAERHARAVQLLEEIGISPRTPKRLISYNPSVTPVRFLEVLKALVRPYGIEIEIRTIAPADIGRLKLKDQWQSFIVDWYLGLPDPSGFFVPMSIFGMKVLGDDDGAVFEGLLRESTIQPDQERLRSLHLAEELMVNRGSIVMLHRTGGAVLYDKKICGVVRGQSHISPLQWLRYCGS